jgi:hypothetical protein
MNSNENIQNIKPEKKQKKSFLSNFIEIEKEDPKEKVQKIEEKPPVTPTPKVVPDREEVTPTLVLSNGTSNDVKQGVKSKDLSTSLSEEERLLLNTGDGVNLIPRKSQAEVKKEKKKFSFSISSMISLFVLVVLSLGVVFFNILSKQQLNDAKKELFEKEAQLEGYSDKILSNNEIMSRVDLYKYLEKGMFSPKEIVEYVMTVVERSGNVNIRSFDLGNDLSFEMSGNTTDLSVVAKLWYLLGIDENVENINLESVGKGEAGASFSFQGQLNTSNFIGK